MKQDGLGVFGGTFDPVHYGHINIAQALLKEFPISELLFLPNKCPPHRQQPKASGWDRFEMLKLATQYESQFLVSPFELEQSGLSYTEVTLANLRKEQGPCRKIFFFLGSDAFVRLDRWFRWRHLLDHAHIVVCQRILSDEEECSNRLKQFISRHTMKQLSVIENINNQNGIFFANTPLFFITATEIRRRIKKKLPCDNYLDPAVLAHIKCRHLYGF